MKKPKKYFIAFAVEGGDGYIKAHGENKKKVLKKGRKRGASELCKYKKGRCVKVEAIA